MTGWSTRSVQSPRLAVRDELGEQATGAVELVAERAAQGEVVIEARSEHAHRPTVPVSLAGQGFASARSAERSTLA